MIDLDAIEKECQQMIADGLGFIAPKSCGNAERVAELVAALKKSNSLNQSLRESNERAESLISYIEAEAGELIKNDYSRYCDIEGIATEASYYLRRMKCEQ